MATSVKAIATVEVGAGGAATIEFTSIPATYTDLVVLGSCRTTVGGTTDETTLTFNGNTSGYSWKMLYGQGSSAASVQNPPSTAIYGVQINGDTSTSNTFGNFLIYVPNYVGNTNKSASIDAVQENNGTTAYMKMVAGLWSDTSAITSLKLSGQSGNFKQYSTATLYGIKG